MPTFPLINQFLWLFFPRDWIIQVLITKLRSATSPETQQSRKAAKALVVLMPLLGITYVFILTGPRNEPTYDHIRALLISTQVIACLTTMKWSQGNTVYTIVSTYSCSQVFSESMPIYTVYNSSHTHTNHHSLVNKYTCFLSTQPTKLLDYFYF